MIKNLLLLFVATILISGCATMNEKSDPLVGQWKFQFSNLPQGDPDALLTINKEGGIYSGTIVNSTDEFELNDLLVDADNSLTAHFQYQGRRVEFSALFDGNTITGQTSMRNRTYSFAGAKIE